jgi:hypothetical protein
MTRGRKLALAGVVVGLGLAAAPAATAALPGFDYAWSQPPPSVPIGPEQAFQPVSAYHWVQPPARIPIA